MRPTVQSRPPTARTSSTGSLGSESAALSALSLDSLVAPDTPIQFDIISPVSEDLPGQAKSSGQSGSLGYFLLEIQEKFGSPASR